MAGLVAADVAGPVAPVVVPVAPAVVPVGGAVTGTYADCIGVCKPVLDVSAMCGLPVPADPALALNPGAFAAGGYRGWKRDAAAPGIGPGGWGGPYGAGPYGGAGAFGGPGAWGAWGGYGGAYGGGVFSQAAIGCVCSTKAVDIVAAETGCITCLAKVTAVTNPCK